MREFLSQFLDNQPEIECTVLVYAVWRSAVFLNERTGLHRKSVFLKMNEIFCLALMLVLSVKMMLSPRSCE